MYSFEYNNHTIRRFKCKDGLFRVLAKDVGDAIGNNNITRDIGSHGMKAVTIVDEGLIPTLSLNERSAMLVTFDETMAYLESRRKNKNHSILLKQYLTDHWNDETVKNCLESNYYQCVSPLQRFH